ncbi:hypothetical protein AVEN_134346-1 [Araneus ventricosus]|uniref:Secreted protein n=1 Tax=Araneus ventricosus TaxID=182803 RepID=A0A4Y2SBP3_ARAVE|nr:hypothetical protein AVEN_134346-1 [Araneus ventricosus]
MAALALLLSVEMSLPSPVARGDATSTSCMLPLYKEIILLLLPTVLISLRCYIEQIPTVQVVACHSPCMRLPVVWSLLSVWFCQRQQMSPFALP